MFELFAAIVLTYIGVAILMYEAGTDAERRRAADARRVATQYDLAMAASRQRHPSAR